MLVVTRQACRHIDPILLETARVFEISPFRILSTVVLPACTPMILGAARTGLAIALLLAVTVEMIAGGIHADWAILSLKVNAVFNRVTC